MKRKKLERKIEINKQSLEAVHTHEQHIYGHSGIKLGNTEY